MDLKSAVSRLDLLKRPQDGNNILKSLQLAGDQLFSTAYGARKGVQKLLILFVGKTDGKSIRLEDAAKNLKERGINVIVIASGSDVNKNDLAGIASDPSKLVVSSDLTNLTNNVLLLPTSKYLPGSFSHCFRFCSSLLCFQF